ncbi:MAG: hypothetical protein AAB965_02380 [Patescibacteria group bacterium]
MYKSYKAWNQRRGSIISLAFICALFTMGNPWGSIGFPMISIRESKEEVSNNI